MSDGEHGLTTDLFRRVDESDDALFYREPRLVLHIDEATIVALSRYYAEVLPAGGVVLDLMSSWVSHLPVEPPLSEVVGLGMNAAELRANPRLSEWVVQDLNGDPRLPFATARFDAVLVAVSVQYLTRPVEVFRDVARVLKPGGRVIVALSHRCFPTKAVRAFHLLSPADRIRFVGEYLGASSEFEKPSFLDRSPERADPLWIVSATKLDQPICEES